MVCCNLVPFVSERKYLLIAVILFLLFLCNTETRAQVGEIFSRSEGEERFGKITERAEMSTASLENILKTADDYLMFGINEGKIVVADRNRSAVYPGNFMLSSDKVMTIYSTSRIAELIARGGAALLSAEQRERAFTLRCGEYILEVGLPCPPYCIE